MVFCFAMVFDGFGFVSLLNPWMPSCSTEMDMTFQTGTECLRHLFNPALPIHWQESALIRHFTDCNNRFTVDYVLVGQATVSR